MVVIINWLGFVLATKTTKTPNIARFAGSQNNNRRNKQILTNTEIGADATSTYDAARIQRSAKLRTAGDEMWWTVRSNWRRTALKTQLNADHVGPRTALSRVCWINDAISPLVEQSRAACRRAAITSLIGQPAKLHWQPNRVQSTADR